MDMNYSNSKIAEGFYSIEEEYVRSFLIEGEKEALLVDTGVGGNLREYAERITKLPIKVVFTHADPDHVGAAEQFEKRLMHPCEFDYYRNRNTVSVPMEPLWEGDVLDIGSFRFEVILIPGHTPGSIALLEREKRFLIGGDSIQTGRIYMFGSGRNFEAFRASMVKLSGLLNEIDIVYASHDKLAVKPELVKQLFTGAGKVMEKTIEGKPVMLHGRTVNCYETDGIAFYAD
jgi:glyoxylase-like metal-dependent hydrolase (beta-lactamase superfamily II)